MTDKIKPRYTVVLGSDGWSVWDRKASRQAPNSVRLFRIEAELLCQYLNEAPYTPCNRSQSVEQTNNSFYRRD
jgi:hypothetical protein